MIRTVKDILSNEDGLLRVRLGVLVYVFMTGMLGTWFVSWLFRAPVHSVEFIFDPMFITLFATAILFNPRVKIRKPKRQ
ncbi:MAG TPA: hypothetical protein VIJ85_03880 [Rhizomicrobium sp.]